MSQTGWWGDKVIITLSANDGRRHKSWCVNYANKKCILSCDKCMGSAHCEKYVCKRGEGPIAPNLVPKTVQHVEITTRPQKSANPPKPNPEPHNPFWVAHIPGHSARYGENLLDKLVVMQCPYGRIEFGVVTEKTSDCIWIERDDGKIKKYSYIEAIRKKGLWVIDPHPENSETP